MWENAGNLPIVDTLNRLTSLPSFSVLPLPK